MYMSIAMTTIKKMEKEKTSLRKAKTLKEISNSKLSLVWDEPF